MAVLVVGVAVLAAGAEISPDQAVVAAWWVAYLVYLGVFLLGAELVRWRPPWPFGVSVALLFLTASGLWLLAPHLGWTALLSVVTTAVAAFELPSRAVVALVAAVTGTRIAATEPDLAAGLDVVRLLFAYDGLMVTASFLLFDAVWRE